MMIPWAFKSAMRVLSTSANSSVVVEFASRARSVVTFVGVYVVACDSDPRAAVTHAVPVHKRRSHVPGVFKVSLPTMMENAQAASRDAELKRANAILKAASVFFAAELTRHPTDTISVHPRVLVDADELHDY